MRQHKEAAIKKWQNQQTINVKGINWLGKKSYTTKSKYALYKRYTYNERQVKKIEG